MNYTIDRIEDDFAVLEAEDMTRREIPAAELPAGAKEGSVLSFDGEFFTLFSVEDEARRRRIIALQNKLRKKKNKT